jgi:hypothetical protein
MKKDVDNLSSSRSLARLTRNSRNTPLASGIHPRSRNKRRVTHHFGPNPVALRRLWAAFIRQVYRAQRSLFAVPAEQACTRKLCRLAEDPFQ